MNSFFFENGQNQNIKENSVDPDETAHMSRLIKIYTVCKNVLILGLKR